MYRKDLTEDELLAFMHEVKEAIPDIPMGYVDAYYEFSHRPRITEACDVILANCYPYWEGCSQEYSLVYMQDMYNQANRCWQTVRKLLLPKQDGQSKEQDFKVPFRRHENAIKYFINSQVWSDADDIEMFYFSSFDESWKVGAEGDVGAYWGLWDKDEKLKF